MSLGGQSQARAQEAEQKVTVIAPEEGQKAETPAAAQSAAPAPTPAEGKKAETRAPAPAPKEKVEALEKIVVTATKTARNPEDVPASITVITKEDIKRQNIQTVDEALRQVPGTFVRRGKGWQDTLASVNLRGFPADGQKRTLVLLDGQDISVGYTNVVRWSSVAVEDIERIEVIRGPFSALYGGTAMGGVINIITKTPKKLEMSANMSYGTYDTWTYYLGGGTRLWDRVSVKASYNYRETSGYPSNLVTRTASGGRAAIQTSGWEQTKTPQGGSTFIIGDSGDNYWNDSTFNTKLNWDIAPGHKLEFSALADWNRYGYGQWHTYLRSTATGLPVFRGTAGLTGGTGLQFTGLQQGTFLSGDGREHTVIYNLNSEHRLTDRTTVKLRGGLVNQPENWYTTPSSSSAMTTFDQGPGTLSSSPSKNWNFEMQVDQAIGSKQVLTGGLVYKTGWSATKEYNLSNWKETDVKTQLTFQSGGRDRDFAFYLQDEITWHPMFTTVLGARFDWWQTYGGNYMLAANLPYIHHLPDRQESSVNPKVAFLFRPWEWWSWRASVGTAFRPPNIYELYRTWRSTTGTIYQGNPHLSPETTQAWEIGTTVKPFKGNVITATYFENYVDNLIYRVLDPNDPTGRTQSYQNAAKASIRGMELEITQKLWSWLDVFGNMTILDARINKNPYDLPSEGKKVTYVPRQMFNFGINAKYWVINANLSGHYVSKMQTRSDNGDVINNVPSSYDPFFTMDGKVTVTPVKYVDLSFAVDNILDRQYFYSYVTPGRTWWLQLGLKY